MDQNKSHFHNTVGQVKSGLVRKMYKLAYLIVGQHVGSDNLVDSVPKVVVYMMESRSNTHGHNISY